MLAHAGSRNRSFVLLGGDRYSIGTPSKVVRRQDDIHAFDGKVL